ncbi:uncharacterized protein F5147DRAFT_789379 [Suillus discolor]|uniref:Uncharacterized protein n=1 Tax=Suillus discolor TaxID=1912936 RepID=A0A9P7ESI2_9AGAM|nr:uncharacterized protein F5147DRAFT_789379 [Suillus discolor]KAG2088550.1 hypothetical protein F5147DRAFT_789379 [Suillus discolor]
MAGACASLPPNSLTQAFTLESKLPSPSPHNGKRLRSPAIKLLYSSVHAWVEIAIAIAIAPQRQAPALACHQTPLPKRSRLGRNCHRHRPTMASACARPPSNSFTQAFTLGSKLPSPSPHNGKRLRSPAIKLLYSSVHAWVEIAIAIAIAPQRQAPALACHQTPLPKRSRLGRNCHRHRPTMASACARPPSNSFTQAFTLGSKLPSPSPHNGKRLRSPAIKLLYSSVHAWVEIAIAIAPQRQAPALACHPTLLPKRPSVHACVEIAITIASQRRVLALACCLILTQASALGRGTSSSPPPQRRASVPASRLFTVAKELYDRPRGVELLRSSPERSALCQLPPLGLLYRNQHPPSRRHK